MGNCLYQNKNQNSNISKITNGNITNITLYRELKQNTNIKNTNWFNNCNKQINNKMIASTYTLKDNKLHGEYLLYDLDGKLIEKLNYVNGVQYGEQIYYNIGILDQHNKYTKAKKVVKLFYNGFQIGDTKIC